MAMEVGTISAAKQVKERMHLLTPAQLRALFLSIGFEPVVSTSSREWNHSSWVIFDRVDRPVRRPETIERIPGSLHLLQVKRTANYKRTIAAQNALPPEWRAFTLADTILSPDAPQFRVLGGNRTHYRVWRGALGTAQAICCHSALSSALLGLASGTTYCSVCRCS